ncbi:hypothetical protein PLESTB_000065500 [Pleodorina starrii]|uniref:Protein kinase domain-containing protein n=1 Tax=Pleodorina starrii TaxID=330485 RepID=A0A9W6BAL6_9CHLO|nr:hypothetical protein PLESTM_001607900 [Pleodorina starrii]GLC48157.1 hypothetical protein PLESTB_000065500 [Pleodorina starrii]GLC67405.1 hypothetical protein PLESTF_000552600 [Pleodorina starrii]
MYMFAKCCLGAPTVPEVNVDAQRLAGRTVATTSTRRRSIPALGLAQACTAACASLPISSCEDQWPERWRVALASLEASLRCSARLVVYSSEGLPWVFAPIEWVAEELDRIALTHLAEFLAQQMDDDTAVVLRQSKDPGHNLYHFRTWSSGQSMVLEQADQLALPISQQPDAHATAALLLSWDRPVVDKTAWISEKHGNASFSASDLKELRRLAQFVGYGLVGDPQHARYVARVCWHLALMPSAPSLHDLVISVLDGVHDLVLAKFGIQLQCVLAAVHGPSLPAVLFAQRLGAGASLLRACGSDVQAQMAALLLNAGSSTSGRPSSRANNAGGGGGGGGCGGGFDPGVSVSAVTTLTASEPCARQEASRVRAIKTSLANTLLQQAISAVCPAEPPREQAWTRDASSRCSQRPSNNDGGGSRGDAPAKTTAARGAFSVRACVAPVRTPCRTKTVLPLIVPNASSHVLEDQQPCRDVLVCSKLTGGKAGSILLMSEAAAGGGGGSPSPDARLLASLPQLPGQVYPSGSAAAAAAAAGEMETIACTIRSSDAAADAAAAAAATATAAAAAAGIRPHHLALYLVSSEVLPAGVLRMIAEELQSVLPIFFGAWRAALAGGDTSPSSCAAGEWRRLQELLLGQSAATADGGGAGSSGMGCGTGAYDPSCAIAASTAAAAAAAVPPPPPPASLLESASNSPLSPVAAHRSAVSTRLFKCHTPPAPNVVTSMPPVYCSGTPASPTPAVQQPRAPPRTPGVSSHGGGLVRKGLLALMAMREEAAATTCEPHQARSMPGVAPAATSAAAAAAAGVSMYGSGGHGHGHGHVAVRSFNKISRPAEGSNVDGTMTTSSVRTGSATPLQPRGSATPLPQLTLEKPAGASALDMLVTSMRQGLTAASADEQEELAVRAQDLAAVQLLEVLGRGGQGVVFRGSLHGLETAVKMLTDASSSGGGGGGGGGGAAAAAGQARDAAADGEAAAAAAGSSDVDTWEVDSKAGEARMRQAKRGAMELAVIGTLSHPSIVQVCATFSGVVVVRCQYQDTPHAEMRLCYPGDELLAGKDPGPLNQIICLEYCDAGTLMTAARAGAFRLPFAIPSNGPAFPALVPLYKSLLEVALALRYLHARKLVHCDLKAANVLLKSSSRDLRGWTCKLSDFGCARMLMESDPKAGEDWSGPAGFRTAAPVGTLAHMAPECFIKNSLLTAAVDIYSFGVLMWELLMCSTPYNGMSAKDLPRQVIRHNLRPTFHPLAPPDYCTLAARCWSAKPERRPSALELVGELEHLLAAAQASAKREAQVAAAAAAARNAAPHSAGAAAAAAAAARRKPLAELDGGRAMPPPPPPPPAAEASGASSGAPNLHSTARRLLQQAPDEPVPSMSPQRRQQMPAGSPGSKAFGSGPEGSLLLGCQVPDGPSLRRPPEEARGGGRGELAVCNSPGAGAGDGQEQRRGVGAAAAAAARPSPEGGGTLDGAASANIDSGGSSRVSGEGSSGGGEGAMGAMGGNSGLQKSAICLLPFTNQDTL